MTIGQCKENLPVKNWPLVRCLKSVPTKITILNQNEKILSIRKLPQPTTIFLQLGFSKFSKNLDLTSEIPSRNEKHKKREQTERRVFA